MNLAGLALIDPVIIRRVRQQSIGDTLVIVFASRQKLELGSADFADVTVLDLADTRSEYYVRHARSVIQGLRRFIRDNQFAMVVCVGFSKGGFAALLASQSLASTMPEVEFRAAAFSPQTSLWPPNENLDLTSYRRLLSRAERKPALMKALQRYGDLSAPAEEPNLRWHIFYGSGHARDAAEAERVRGAAVRQNPLATSTHWTIIPHLCTDMTAAELKVFADHFMATATKTIDGRSELTFGAAFTIVEDVLGLGPRPSLGQLVADIVRS